MANRNRFTAEQMIEALKTTKGMVYLAAQRLGCDPDTVQSYCKRYPTVEAAKVAARGEMIDLAELTLWKAIQNGEGWAVSLCLKTIGKHRGYVERQEVVGEVNLTTSPEWQQLRAGILAALRDYPEARLALAAVLSPPSVEHVNGTGH